MSTLPRVDPYLAEAQARVLEALARDWRRKLVYAVRHRRLPPERLALLLTGLAGELVDQGDRFAAAEPAEDD